jgi:hypothetical protein
VEAIKAADIQLNGELGSLSHKTKRSKATILQSPLYCGEETSLVKFIYNYLLDFFSLLYFRHNLIKYIKAHKTI